MDPLVLAELIIGLEPEAVALITLLVQHLKRTSLVPTPLPIPAPLPNPPTP